MPATQVRRIPSDGTSDAVSLKALLKGLKRLRRDKDHLKPAEKLASLLKLRSTDGAFLDVVDGLILRAERDGVSDADREALTAELNAIRDWACGLA